MRQNKRLSKGKKGVKKKVVDGKQHVHHGVVTNIEAHKNGKITLTIKSHSHKKKTAVAVAATTTHHHKFSVSQTTVVSVASGKTHVPASIQAIHKGEHVTVTSVDHHAEKIVIHTHRVATAKIKVPKKIK